MKLRHCIVGLASAAALSLGMTGSAVAGGTPAFTCHAAVDNVYLYADGPGMGTIDGIIHTGQAFYGHYTVVSGGVFWSFGHTGYSSYDMWVRTNQLRC